MNAVNTKRIMKRFLKVPSIMKNRNFDKLEKFYVLSDLCGSVATIKTSATNRNVPRLVRQEPGKVVCGFIPQEYFLAFHSRTGVTGFPTFLFTFGTFLASKEYYVLEHDFYVGISFALLWIIIVKKIGPDFAKSMDKEIDDYENAWKTSRETEKKFYEDTIAEEQKNQEMAEGELLLLEAKRFNVALQLEQEFRKRLHIVYVEVKKRLDYQVALAAVEQLFLRKNIADWVEKEVRKSFTAEKDQEMINHCLQTLPEILKSEGL
ncbi:ATP synthase subunit b, mitochondrial-like [Agrilus planipennis]|uniref:ATP synthase subunit b n=1 Tax=Agrilus planipennis TaxID=224129 RepID=A0A1W4XH43_AGRPL|nr:ATP synthase subunit b, mitochondrial-like [Agrilus planipennis]